MDTLVSTKPPLHVEREAEIVRGVEEEVIFGRIAPGARLTEEALCARYDVTRHSVRRALLELERMGIVVLERNKGATVRALTSDEVRQIYEMRELLQREAALRIPLPAPAAVIDDLRVLQSEYCARDDAGDLRGVHEANDRFHLAFFAACGNQFLVDSISQYMRLSLTIRSKTLADPAERQIARAHHQLMIDMLRGRDGWVLAQLCVEHIQPSKRAYLARAAREFNHP